MTTAAYCPRCAHYRLRQRPQLFSAADMQSTGGLKASLEWEQQQDQLRLLEQQRMDAGEVLTYEPQFHPWCAAASPFDEAILQAVDEATAGDDAERPGLAGKARDLARVSRDEASDLIARAKQGDYDAITRLVEGRRVTVNPVAGDIQPTYVLCQRVNRQSRCPLFEPKET
jgi:hypothetical protein